MKNKKMTYGIIGLGRFGMALAQKLSSMGAEILVTDKDENKVSLMRELTENAFVSNDLERKTLSDMGFSNCDVVVVCIAGAIDVSILTVMKLHIARMNLKIWSKIKCAKLNWWIRILADIKIWLMVIKKLWKLIVMLRNIMNEINTTELYS